MEVRKNFFWGKQRTLVIACRAIGTAGGQAGRRFCDAKDGLLRFARNDEGRWACADDSRTARCQMSKSFFASFFSKKEVLTYCLPY
jgi:hypothetical protein